MIKLVDLLKENHLPVDKAVSAINSISANGIEKLEAKKKIIKDKSLVSKMENQYRYLHKQNLPDTALNVVEIVTLKVAPEQQGKGIGTIVFDKIREIADANKAIIYLEAVPIGNKSMTTYQLVDFYKKFGFEMIKGGKKPVMVYMPKIA